MNEIQDPQTICMSRKFAEDLLENLYHLQAEWQHKEESRYRRETEEYGTLHDDIRELQALLGDDREMDLPCLPWFNEDEEDIYYYDIRMRRIESQIEESLTEESARSTRELQEWYRDDSISGIAHRWKCTKLFFRELVDWLCSPLGSEDDYHHRWWMGTWANEVFPEWWQIWPRKCPDCGRRWRKCPNNGDDCVPF